MQHNGITRGGDLLISNVGYHYTRKVDNRCNAISLVQAMPSRYSEPGMCISKWPPFGLLIAHT